MWNAFAAARSDFLGNRYLVNYEELVHQPYSVTMPAQKIGQLLTPRLHQIAIFVLSIYNKRCLNLILVISFSRYQALNILAAKRLLQCKLFTQSSKEIVNSLSRGNSRNR